MHHEPIIAGITELDKAPVPLVDIHGFITEILGWIDPVLATTLGFVARFPDIRRDEESRIRGKLQTHFGIP